MSKTNDILNSTIADMVSKNAALYPDGIAYIFEDKSYTWGEAQNIIDRFIVKFNSAGIRKETHLGVWSVTNDSMIFALLALMCMGAVPAAINYSYKAYELERVLNKADITYMLIGENKKGSNFKAIFSSIRDKVPIIVSEIDLPLLFEQIVQEKQSGISLSVEEQETVNTLKNAVTSENVACITFTSGTTAVPKPVMLTHKGIVNNAAWCADRLGLTQKDVLLGPFPMFHSSGIAGTVFQPLINGTTSILVKSFDADETIQNIGKYGVTALLAIPSMLELMMKCESYGKYDTSTLRIGETAGSAILPEKLIGILNEFGFKHFAAGYGQTECSALVTFSPKEDGLYESLQSAGTPLPCTQVRIADAKTGCVLGTGETGEIQVKGPIVMKGYYNCPEENEKKFTEDGWLKTTDAGYFDKDGRLHFVTRLSEIIIWNGENISPLEIENVIKTYSPAIIDVKVVGVEADIVGEEIVCLLELKAGYNIDFADLKQYIKSSLASYKVPKYFFVIDSMPRLATSKIDLGEARRIAALLKKELVTSNLPV